MQPIDPTDVVATVSLALGAIVWLVRLEGRINVTDARFEEILKRLERIETKQDRERV